jgi:hypothetical protein
VCVAACSDRLQTLIRLSIVFLAEYMYLNSVLGPSAQHPTQHQRRPFLPCSIPPCGIDLLCV